MVIVQSVMNFERISVTTAHGRVGGTLSQPLADNLAMPLIVCIYSSGCASNYFDVRGNSFVEEAARRAIPTLLVDRPSHGASEAFRAGSTMDQSVEAVVAIIQTVCVARPDLAVRPLVLIGHSFGGMVAIVAAAWRTQADTMPRTICVSGIGDQPDVQYGVTPVIPASYWLFGPGRTHDLRGVTVLRAAAALWRNDEAADLRQQWPVRWPDVVGAIKSSVHFRLAEFERIWDVSPASFNWIAAAFIQAWYVDVAIGPDGGHLYVAHLRGAELVAAQLDFARAAVAAPSRVLV